MNIKDITADWKEALKLLDDAPEINISPNDSIDWRGIRYQGYDAVSIEGNVYQFCKHGLLDVIVPDSKSDDQ